MTHVTYELIEIQNFKLFFYFGVINQIIIIFYKRVLIFKVISITFFQEIYI